jgi:hypothetical protein
MLTLLSFAGMVKVVVDPPATLANGHIVFIAFLIMSMFFLVCLIRSALKDR